MQEAKFDAVDLSVWRQRAEKELRGAPFARLTQTTPEGFVIEPLYTTAPNRRNLKALQRGDARVKIVGLLDGPLAGDVVAAIGAEQGGGVDGVTLDARAVDAWPRAAPGFAFNSNGTTDGADKLAGLLRDSGPVMAAIDTALWRDDAIATQHISWLRQWSGANGALAVDLRRWHEAGADAATELGAGLSALVSALRRLHGSGFAVGDVAPRFVVRIPVASDFLMQTAKLRAWQGLTARVIEVLGAPTSTRPAVFAESSRRALTRSDPWVNLLRGTASAFAAIIGGADFIGIQPFDAAARASNQDALRLARNTLHILISESHVDEVADPAAGSYAIETWTAELEARAWALFQTIEARGGAYSDGGVGVIADAIAASTEVRAKKLRTRQAALIGTTLFVDGDEAPLEGTPSDLDLRVFGPRDSLTFEALRGVAKAAAKTVFIANTGPLGEQQARSSWVRDLFAAGGYQARDGGDGFGDASEAIAAFAETPCPLAVISAADARLPELIPELAAALRARGATRVLCAGRPGTHEAEWRARGVDGFFYAGMDIASLFEDLLAERGA